MTLVADSATHPNTAPPARTRGERLVMAAAVAVAAMIALPIVAVIVLAAFPDENIWPHLFATVLPGYVTTTGGLMAGVGLITLFVGTGTAWLVTMYTFPGRGAFEWLLLVPLAMPTYIIAYTYVDVFDYSGLVQSSLRQAFGWQSARDYWFPEIRSLGGAIFVMSFVLYPYVYLTARAAFEQQSFSMIEAARTLGHSLWSSFVRVALPMARPAIAIGVILALMETLNDIGAVQYFGVNTLTVGVYTTWLQKNNLGGAAQIATIMLAFVFLLIWIERWARQGRRFHQTVARHRFPVRHPLTGKRALAAAAVCALPIVIGFVVPGAVLAEAAITYFDADSLRGFTSNVFNSLTLATLAASLTLLFGIFLSYASRLSRTRPVRGAALAASVGYAVPGTVLAIGILVPLAGIDNFIDGVARANFGFSTGLLLSGTIFAITYAYVVRFMAISYGAIDAGFGQASPNLHLAARVLGRTPYRTLREVHLPLLKPAIATAALLVFVDAMKELPATLLLRPFNFDTLATHVYTYASLEAVEEASLSALAIVGVGILPVMLLNRTFGRRGRAGTDKT
ncbi:Ferric iron ABC transporter, permease protein [hydrothermal vent metagenome]|uniref:Ferric iron ABC transporter, permease protein n=1 Tax=hydrothermal vent metagenome TaxID=652676 RepID=A0A3B0TS37_9ZZZZ